MALGYRQALHDGCLSVWTEGFGGASPDSETSGLPLLVGRAAKLRESRLQLCKGFGMWLGADCVSSAR
jgi:hypothetical protein